MEASEKKESQIFGSFYLGGSEFALSVTHIQEVVNPPAAYTNVPLAPAYLKGIFNLRGAIVPVVDLQAILRLPKAAAQEGQKIAIIEYNGFSIGLLFDRTGEIFKSNPDERAEFNNEGSNVISGVFKKDNGLRLVQIFDVDALFKLQNLPLQREAITRRKESIGRKRGNRKQCISFHVGRAKCALGIDEIQEILKIDKVNETALATDFSIGVIDLRGSTVPMVDFAALLGYRDADGENDGTSQVPIGNRRVVVVKIESRLIGLMVDGVDSIVTYFPDDLLPFPVMSRERPDMYAGCISFQGSVDILLLEHRKIFTDAEIIDITHGHSNLYNIAGNKDRKAKGHAGQRKTYITFTVETPYAIAIEEVKEIIEYPKKLMHPPGLAKHFDGVLNLRGELITIVDARTLYSSKDKGEIATKKVLVFKRSNVHFGLVVDSVEAIVSFFEGDKIKLPGVLHQNQDNGLIEDVIDAIQFGEGDEAKALLILSADNIANRVAKSKVAA